MTENFFDNRRLKRFIVNAKVYDRDSGEVLGYTGNMHTEGMKLISVDQVGVGTEFRVKLEYLDAADELTEIHLEAECLWNGPGPNDDFHSSGFRFLRITVEQIRAIERLIATLAVRF